MEARYGASNSKSATGAESQQPRALYRQLPCGRRAAGGLSREQVEVDQRLRLQGAMIEAVARHGYAATTVGEVVALAGVSKKTLYKHFASKEACFLATHDTVVGEGLLRILAAHREGSAGGRDWTQGLCAALDALVREVAARPRAAWLALVEVLAVGPGALERIENGEKTCAEMIERSLVRGPGATALPPVLARAVVHGIWYVVRQRLLEERIEELPDSSAELLRWVLVYSSHAAASLPRVGGPIPANRIARLRNPQRSARLSGDERTRMLQAAAQIAIAGGYESLTGAQIAEWAEVPRERFQELFDSAEECFLSYLELGCAQVLAHALGAAEGAPDWPAAACRAIDSMLWHIADDAVFARAAFVEIFATGHAGVRRRATLCTGFAEFLMRRTPRALRPNPLTAEVITGAVWGMIHREVVRGRARSLPALSEYAAYVALAPLFGGEAAMRAIVSERERSNPERAV